MALPIILAVGVSVIFPEESRYCKAPGSETGVASRNPSYQHHVAGSPCRARILENSREVANEELRRVARPRRYVASLEQPGLVHERRHQAGGGFVVGNVMGVAISKFGGSEQREGRGPT